MTLNPNAFVDGVMNGFLLHIEPPSYYSHIIFVSIIIIIIIIIIWSSSSTEKWTHVH